MLIIPSPKTLPPFSELDRLNRRCLKAQFGLWNIPIGENNEVESSMDT